MIALSKYLARQIAGPPTYSRVFREWGIVRTAVIDVLANATTGTELLALDQSAHEFQDTPVPAFGYREILLGLFNLSNR